MAKQKKKALIISIIVVALIAIIATIVFIVSSGSNDPVSNSNIYNIHYTKGDTIYYIQAKDNSIKVEEYDMVVCIKEPCDPIKKDEYQTEYKAEYKTLFEEIYQNFEKQGDYVRISSTDDTIGQGIIKTLDEIVQKKQ